MGALYKIHLRVDITAVAIELLAGSSVAVLTSWRRRRKKEGEAGLASIAVFFDPEALKANIYDIGSFLIIE